MQLLIDDIFSFQSVLFSYYVREEIVTWARKKTGVPVVRVCSEIEASEFVKKHTLYAVGFFEKFEV